MAETILIVDDEEPVRRTFQDWLSASGWDVQVVAVADAEAALLIANQRPIDLAILDWNLGSGSDGLRLLEDLVEFHPDIIAILVTGFAHQATPLQALRMGVRDYLDKNQDLNRETFLAAVRRQLDRIIPAKRHRQFTRSLLAFRESVEKVLPLVQASAALNDPVPLPDAIRSLFRFLLRTTHAHDGALVVRHVAADGPESFLAYDPTGARLGPLAVPFARSLAAMVISLQEPCAMTRQELRAAGPHELQPFEKERSSLLAAAMAVGPGVQVVLELFDKASADGFNDADRRLAAAAADFGAELLRQALAERQTNRVLVDAVEEALRASTSIVEAIPARDASTRMEEPPPESVLERLREGFDASASAVTDAKASIRLAEAVRELAVRHGTPAVEHCTGLVEALRDLLDRVTGASNQ
jgi:ActR/RegA family two-component response regulator